MTPGPTWPEVLDRLERDVAEVEAALAAGEAPSAPDPWSPPDPGPLPEALRARAHALLLRQREVQDAVARAREGCRRQQAYTAAVSQATRGPVRPAYVDVRG